MVELFILGSYVIGTAFGYYLGKQKGRYEGITTCIDNLINQGYLKYRGVKNNPEILKHNEDY